MCTRLNTQCVINALIRLCAVAQKSIAIEAAGNHTHDGLARGNSAHHVIGLCVSADGRPRGTDDTHTVTGGFINAARSAPLAI
eukprot:scaffold176832_cov35-Tisochrysis_lutea.AAC.6